MLLRGTVLSGRPLFVTLDQARLDDKIDIKAVNEPNMTH